MESNKPLVLIAEDHMPSLLIAKKSLKKAGFEVVEASDGEEVLKIIRETIPDLILLDVMMPKKDGYSVCSILRKTPKTKDIPIIMLTGLEDKDSIEKAYEVGATDFVTKPINWFVVNHRIRYMIRASKVQRNLIASEQRLEKAQKIASIASWEWRPETNDCYWSGILYDILGTTVKECPASYENLMNFAHTDDRSGLELSLQNAINNKEHWEKEHRIEQQDGNIIYVQHQVEVIQSNPLIVAGTVQNISERKLSEEKIRHMAYFDNLTDLPNREHYKEHINKAIEYAKKHKSIMAVLYVDLDKFKIVNDTLGHNAGDLLLKETAKRLKQCVRVNDVVTQAKSSDSVIARFGGDEFTLLLTELKSPADAEIVAKRILSKLQIPLIIMDQEITITASIGISLYPNDGETADLLIKNADMAMFHAKKLEKDNYLYFNDTMSETALRRLSIKNGLRKAIEHEEFILYYQPKVGQGSHALLGAELLIRWQHPEWGLVPPDVFIPIAEETRLLIPIGEWVILSAIKQIRKWIDEGVKPHSLAVNIANVQFQQDNFVKRVKQLVEEYQIPPEYLEFEITESCIIDNLDKVIEKLHRLRKLGIKISLDDFGTGYSSLSHIKNIPLDKIKIDRSFLQDFPNTPDSFAIVKSIIEMANQLHLKVVVEGLETKEQLVALQKFKCDEYQGYYFSRPLPFDEFEAKFVV